MLVEPLGDSDETSEQNSSNIATGSVPFKKKIFHRLTSRQRSKHANNEGVDSWAN